MSDFYILDENKNPIETDLLTWGAFLEKEAYKNRIVGKTKIGDKKVSTVFLGLDHRWDMDKPPLIFETMVFEDNRNEIHMERYSTWKEAEEGHERACRWVLNGCKDE